MYTKNEQYFRALNPSTPARMLRQLANHPDAPVRACVAENDSTPGDVLDKLSRDADSVVRLALTLNPTLPPALLWALAFDACADIRFSIAENPLAQMEILLLLCADENPYVAQRAERTVESVMKHYRKQKGGVGNYERFRRAIA